MKTLNAVLALVQLANFIAGWAEKRGHIKEGEARALKRAQKLHEGRLRQALEARRNARDSVGSDGVFKDRYSRD